MYYYKSEKLAAYWALRDLEAKLPAQPSSAAHSPEWGTILFRWPDSEEGGFKYSYQWPLYEATTPDGLWAPRGKIPSFAEEWAFCHTHPNNGFFSTTDTNTATTMRTVMYMVNRLGGYWFNGRIEGLSKSQRYGLLWGSYPPPK